MKRKEVLTTGEVAKICCVAPRTVSKWFDTGRLRGYRIPGSRDRRIPLTQLIRFMKDHDMPLSDLEGNVTRILLVTPPDSETAAIADDLCRVDQYELQIASNEFEVGMKAGDFHPHVILVDIQADATAAKEILRNLRLNLSLAATRIVALTGALTDGQKRTLMRQGFDDVVSSPYKFDKLVATIETATDLIS
ncbi:MAG: helix-turn-helix domain-containing protein [Phycisphaerae bacterium]|nr:helix-turn-helix domain-containing protein [Phycisphaerae bacterium]